MWRKQSQFCKATLCPCEVDIECDKKPIIPSFFTLQGWRWTCHIFVHLQTFVTFLFVCVFHSYLVKRWKMWLLLSIFKRVGLSTLIERTRRSLYLFKSLYSISALPFNCEWIKTKIDWWNFQTTFLKLWYVFVCL